ncbi:MAG TPA: ATP-binding cassette domain-containing protein, partial [Acidimicrobiia bacterium]
MSAARPLPEPIETNVPRAVPAGERLLEINGLKTHFKTRDGVVRAVDEVDLHVDRGEVLGIVGESGCGKSVTSLSIMGLV